MSAHTDNERSEEGSCSAATCSSCDGCQWQAEGEAGDWCYMFQDAPETLPCTQHDKYEVEREAVTALVRKHPSILSLLSMTISETNV